MNFSQFSKENSDIELVKVFGKLRKKILKLLIKSSKR
jgi:hypothetical protein